MTDLLRRTVRAPGARIRSCAAAVAVLALVGCTPPGLPAPIAPTATSVRGSVGPVEPRITVGIDGAVQGFNPHAIADYSLADAAVAQLVLPSVSSVAADGTVRLNADVVRKAEVTSTVPFTITYTLDRNASWSDGTPITAEDFSYLYQSMLVQPGTVDPAGYQAITSITSKDAGKTVEVVFGRRIADWKTLFSPLLPSHILKDSPGGWTEGLAAGIPVSGNRYKMQGYDAATGEITLVRNDKYWQGQPGPSIAVLRIGSPTALIQALGRGDLQAVYLQPDAAEQRILQTVAPVDHRVVVPLPGTVQLVFNTVTGAAADVRVRRAVAAGLDLAAIRAVLSGGNLDGAAPSPSLLRLPATSVGPSAGSPSMSNSSSDAAPGPPTPTASAPIGGTTSPPAAGGSMAVAELLAAGYTRKSLYLRKDGHILRLRLAYSGGDARMAAAARLIQQQLAQAGIEVDLVRADLRTVLGVPAAVDPVALTLAMVTRGPSDGLAAASAFGCPASSSTVEPGQKDLGPRAGNLSGFCSAAVQQSVDQATDGSMPGDLNGLLQASLPVLTISRPSAIFAASAGIAPILSGAGRGWVFSGPLSGLPGWPPG